MSGWGIKEAWKHNPLWKVLMIYAPKKFETKLVELRPIHDAGDHCVTSALQDAEYIGVYVSDGSFPVTQHETYPKFTDALNEAIRLGSRNIWYNEDEVLVKVDTVESLLVALREFYVDEPGDEQDRWLQKVLGLEMGFGQQECLDV